MPLLPFLCVYHNRSKGVTFENGNFKNISMGQGQEKPAEAVVEAFAKVGYDNGVGWCYAIVKEYSQVSNNLTHSVCLLLERRLGYAPELPLDAVLGSHSGEAS